MAKVVSKKQKMLEQFLGINLGLISDDKLQKLWIKSGLELPKENNKQEASKVFIEQELPITTRQYDPNFKPKYPNHFDGGKIGLKQHLENCKNQYDKYKDKRNSEPELYKGLTLSKSPEQEKLDKQD